MYTPEKQKLLLELLVSSADTFAMCKSIIKPSYFDPEFRNAVDFLSKYYDKFHSIPTANIIKAETSVNLTFHKVSKDQVKYCAEEIEYFCRRKALESAIVQSTKYIAEDDGGKVEELIKEALSVSLTKDLGLNYFEDPETRLERAAQSTERYPIGLQGVDDALGGGLARSELLLFCAVSGGGKSLALSNVALNYSRQELNVLFLSLELSEDLLAQRHDIMVTGIPSVLAKTRYKEIAESINRQSDQYPGQVRIKRMYAGTTSNQIRSYLKEFELTEGFIPDVLIVDYLDLMSPNQKVNASDVFTKDKLSSEQLRDILEEYKMIGCSASQLNRSGIDADALSMSMIAGGLSKTMTCDWQIAIVLTPAMKEAGEAMMEIMKARSSDATGKQILLGWDNARLTFTNPKGETTNQNNVSKTASKKQKRSTNLMDLMETE